jgi:protein ImuB
LVERCLEALGRLNLAVCVGIAANPGLALLAAREANPSRILRTEPGQVREFLSPLPVEFLEFDPEIIAVLRVWGIKTLGELAALPREGVVERLGAGVLPLWRQLNGGEPRPLNVHRPTEILTEAMDFEHDVEQLEALLFVLNRFLNSLSVRLTDNALVAESLRLELRFGDGNRHERVFRIAEPTRDVDVLLRTLHTWLEGFRAAAPVVGVRLTATPARQPQQQLDLFQPSLRDPNRFAETLSRLEALVGTGRIGSPEVLPGHRPDAFKVVPFNPEAGEASIDQPKPAVKFGPALRRFRPPLPARIELKKELDAATLLRISAGQVQGRIKASRGPWLASGDWWDRGHWQRREWDIELEGGGVYRIAEQDQQWQVDGEYD